MPDFFGSLTVSDELIIVLKSIFAMTRSGACSLKSQLDQLDFASQPRPLSVGSLPQ